MWCSRRKNTTFFQKVHGPIHIFGNSSVILLIWCHGIEIFSALCHVIWSQEALVVTDITFSLKILIISKVVTIYTPIYF